jgi:hypothetical protein
MYTGTLLNDLMRAVERAEQRAQQKRVAEETELRRLFTLQTPPRFEERIFAGAA